MKTLAFIFDFDGVICDSISSLYNVYLNFLQKFNTDTSHIKEDFDKLNGSNTDEIVSYIKSTYNLKEAEAELKNIYSGMIEESLANLTLNCGIYRLLNDLTADRYPLFLVTQASESYINNILLKYDIKHLFTSIITGEHSGTKAEKFLTIKRCYPQHIFLVTEDSDNGINAAIDASLKVLFYNNLNRESKTAYDYEINDFMLFYTIIDQLKEDCFTIDTFNDLKLNIIDSPVNISAELSSQFETIWQSEIKQGKKLYDNPILCYHSHKYLHGSIIINVFWSNYKYFFCCLKTSCYDIEICPLAVSGIICDNNSNFVIAKRINTTQYNGYLELVPSGSIDKSSERNGEINVKSQIFTEYCEEANGNISDVSSIVFLGLVYDFKDKVYDVCMQININKPLETLNIHLNNEYKELSISSIANAKQHINKFAPTSKLLLTLFEKQQPYGN